MIDKPVELMDLMPTFLDAAGVDIPVTVDGESLVPLMKDESSAWRDFVHGECCNVPSSNSGMQYVTDGKRKFAWFPGKDEELFFDLEEDPQEVHNLSNDPDRAIEVATWRGHLIAQLGDRPEGFTDGGASEPKEVSFFWAQENEAMVAAFLRMDRPLRSLHA